MNLGEPSKKTTIYDIARVCEVSVATVSRVLSKSGYPVSAPTREKIEKAAEEMKYIPNLLGKNLKTNSNDEIGVVIPNLSNYYYTILLQGIQDIVMKNGYQMILCNSYRDVGIEHENVNCLLQKRVKGILIVSIDLTGDTIRQIQEKNVAMVAMEQEVNVECSRASFRFSAGAQLAVEHLIACGHREIAFVSGPLIRTSRQRLLVGYKQCLEQHGIPVREEYIFVEHGESDEENYEFQSGRRAVQRLLSLPKPPTAIFCINDMYAIGVVKQLHEQQISIPDQMAVIGFDNIPFAAMMTPGITTVDQSAYDLGKYAADLLFKIIAGDRHNVSINLEPKLIIRESTQKRTSQAQP